MSLVYYFFETQCINQVLQFCLLTLFQIRCIPECNILIRIVWRLWQLRAHKNLPFHVKWLSRHAGVGRFSERNCQALSMVCVTLEDITTSCTKTDHWNNAECASSARQLWTAGICYHRRSLMLHHWRSLRTDWTNSWTATSCLLSPWNLMTMMMCVNWRHFGQANMFLYGPDGQFVCFDLGSCRCNLGLSVGLFTVPNVCCRDPEN